MLKIPFFRLGVWKHPVYGDLKIDQKIFDQLLANFKANILGQEPFIRIGHDKPDNQTFGAAEALAWIKELKQEGDVLVAMAEPVNEEIEKLIKEKRYRFASAEYMERGKNRETGEEVGALLSAIALTNEPFLTKLPEATLLAGGEDLFYLDYETGGNKMEELLKKLADMMNNFIGTHKADEYGWEKEEWRQMQQSNTQKNINKGTYETDFTYELPSATDNKSISVIKLEMLRPEGHVQETLGKGTGKTQLYVLPHYAKKETILSNAQFSYDEESRIIKVIGAVNEDVTISYDWAAETQKIHGLVAAWNE